MVKGTSLLFLLLLAAICCYCQGIKLQSARHGLHLINGNVPMEAVIDDIRFADGKDDNVDIVRFDILSESHGFPVPLIISTKEPILVDSLGQIPLKLHSNSLRVLIDFISQYDLKVHKKKYSEYLFRVTYRFNGHVYQYYVATAEASSNFFKTIVEMFQKEEGKEALNRLYEFIGSSGLIKGSRNGQVWKY